MTSRLLQRFYNTENQHRILRDVEKMIVHNPYGRFEFKGLEKVLKHVYYLGAEGIGPDIHRPDYLVAKWNKQCVDIILNFIHMEMPAVQLKATNRYSYHIQASTGDLSETGAGGYAFTGGEMDEDALHQITQTDDTQTNVFDPFGIHYQPMSRPVNVNCRGDNCENGDEYINRPWIGND